MSYCRWVNDNCDLHCFEDVRGGYTTMIADYRRRLWSIFFDWLTKEKFCLFPFPHWLTHKKIRLPYKGEEFNDNTLTEFYERIKWLIGLGYKVPDYVLETIKNEMNEQPRKTNE